MNFPPRDMSEAQANESIVGVNVDDGKRRISLSNLSRLSSSRRLKPEPSLYPAVSDLPRIENADEVWASSSRQLDTDGKMEARTDKRSVATSSASDKGAINQDYFVNDNHDSDDISHASIESGQYKDRKIVEVTPGKFYPLRGAEETMRALDYGQVVNVVCVFCGVDLVVHAAATMIICPECEMIAPLETEKETETTSLGLGLRFQQTGGHNRDPDDDAPSP